MLKKELASPKIEEPVPAEEQKKSSVLIRWIGGIDRPFLFLLIILLALGAVMIFTASYSYAQTNFGDSFLFSRSHLIVLTFGLILMIGVIYIPDRWMRKFSWLAYLFAVVLNIAVYFIGSSSHGAKRWIEIGIKFQPSELLKIATILVCATFATSAVRNNKKGKLRIIPFFVLLGIDLVVLFPQTHVSAMVICYVIVMSMYFICGGGWKTSLIFGGLPLAGGVFAVTNADTLVSIAERFKDTAFAHAYTRLLVWRNPFQYMRDDATNWAGWQPSQSLYAISSGGVWGVGLGQSMEKHGYLPEPQNDYIFAILCEEFGFVGAVAVIGLFAALILRGFYIARNCRDKFCQMVIYGLMIKLAMQVIFNIGVVTSVLPSTGISLPFFSYGGTALVMSLIEMGIVLSFSRYSYTERGEEN